LDCVSKERCIMSDIEFDIVESFGPGRPGQDGPSIRFKVNVRANKRIKYNTPLIQDYIDTRWHEVAIFSSRQAADYFLSLIQNDKAA